MQDGYPGEDATRPGPESNNGIYIGGNVGAFATGKYGRAAQITTGPDTGDPLEVIDRLLQQLEASANVLTDEQADDVIDDTHRLHTELHSRRPSLDVIRGALARLTNATSSAATLLATVDQIKDLVGALMH